MRKRPHRPRTPSYRFRPTVERLESREVPAILNANVLAAYLDHLAEQPGPTAAIADEMAEGAEAATVATFDEALIEAPPVGDPSADAETSGGGDTGWTVGQGGGDTGGEEGGSASGGDAGGETGGETGGEPGGAAPGGSTSGGSYSGGGTTGGGSAGGGDSGGESPGGGSPGGGDSGGGDPGDATGGLGGGGGATQNPLSVRLVVPEITKDPLPTMTVIVDNYESFTYTLFVEVDLNKDGDFADANELAQDFAYPPESTFNSWVQPLDDGIYPVRARIVDDLGNTATSSTVMLHVDTHIGYIGSWSLAEIADYALYMDPDAAAEQVQTFLDERSIDQWSFDDQGRIYVAVRATLNKYVNDLKDALVADRGMVVRQTAPAQGLIIGYLPVTELSNLQYMDHFATATPMVNPIYFAGQVQTQGDAVMNADNYRANTGFGGSGVDVGVLSDSVNQFNTMFRPGSGLNESQNSNDLPNNVTVLQDGPNNGTDEGRAMLEIVHDVAPGANLFFHTGSFGAQNFANGITALVNAGVDVLIDDVRYSNSPMFNDGVIAAAAQAAVNAGRIYAAAAGNDADVGWIDTWNAMNGTAGGIAGVYHDLGGGDMFQNFFLGNNQRLRLSFQWDNAFLENGSTQANYQVTANIDVIITDTSNNLVAQFNTDNLNSDEAWEDVNYLNNTGMGRNLRMSFRFVNSATATAPTRLRWVRFGSTNADPNAQDQGAPTIYGQPVARDVIAVGAVPFNAPDTAESFTALGGDMEILFDASGNRLSNPEIRRKPEMAAPDLGDTTFFGNDIMGDGNFFPNFSGTSAAAPHLGAAAALIRQASPSLTPAQMLQFFQQTAVDTHTSGFDFLTGAGYVFLPDSAFARLPADQFESNDSEDVATSLGTIVDTLTLEELTIHDNRIADDDWFRFRADRAGTLRIDMEIVNGFFNADLDIRLFTVNANGTMIELANSLSKQNGGTEAIQVNVTADMELYLYVYGYDRSMAEYKLTFTLT
jgi:hypothetical protein